MITNFIKYNESNNYKYIILENKGLETLIVFEVVKSGKIQFTLIRLYEYLKNVDKLLKEKGKITQRLSTSTVFSSLVYETNNLQDAIDKLKVLTNTKKYNL